MSLTKCPFCEIAMEVQSFEDVLIDICPSCRGVWLDRGEMHKIIAHVRRQEAEMPSRDLGAVASPPPRSEPPREERPDDRYDERDTGQYRGRRKKRSLWDVLEEIID